MMSTLYKSLTISFLAVLILHAVFTVDFAGAQNTAAGTAETQRSADPLLSRYLRFDRLTTEDGPSGDQAYHIAQNRYGFMWFATADELSRYDGSSIKVYRHDLDDPSSLGHNVIRALFTDQSGVLVVFTWGGGLNQYDQEKDNFIRYRQASNDPHSLSNNLVSSVFEDSTGVLWVGTWEGLNQFDPKMDQFAHYPHDPDDPTRLSYNEVTSICEDRSGSAIQSSVKMNKYGLTGVKNNDD
jgi:hypothetical protein